MPIPEVGDASFGVLTTIEEPGGGVLYAVLGYKPENDDVPLCARHVR